MSEETSPEELERSSTGRSRHAAPKRGQGVGGVLRSSAVMAAGTVVSRATGLIRQVLQAAALGTGLLATTYNQANTVPTSLYFLLIGGALNSVLVPQLVRARAEDPDGGAAFEQRLVTLVLCVLGVGTALATWAAPAIISIYQRDTPATHDAFELTVVFARFLLPQIFFYGVFSIFGQVLNARNRFGAMMWAPVLNNLILITMFGLYVAMMTAPEKVSDITDAQVRLLGIGTTTALALQALALIPYAREAGFRLRPRFDWRGTGLRKSVNAARWTLLFVLANLMASTVVTRLASSADAALPHDGVGYTAYSYAQQIWMLPQSIVTVSLVTALLPRMSRAVTEHRVEDLRADLSRALRTSGVVIVPAAFFFVALGPQIAQLLFAHGAANPAATTPLGHMLQAFGLGLIPFSAQYLLLRGFYAFEDTRTPFRMALWISGINIALAVACHLLLSPRWAVTGMAAAYTLSYAIGLLLTALRLRQRTEGLLDGRRICRTYAKLITAATGAGSAGWLIAHSFSHSLASVSLTPALSLTAGGITMLLLFLLLARLLRIGELRSLPGLG
ncbi:murein biosynthesis integral membrane protein MurJ [Streptomyces rapamycinicus]|uniref:Murein biosynthesis integral membrane protein MurJ n=2 Tax=Streptomyces rapamycinicus TaxID=1226757 RepID=A0A3L8QXK3_STRRN|nr:murein biosynthesis integral membrane protein MurJ [Streptomyces rapamycinicus]MBB4787326.1 putative peptidoglycan lipid II flippase [Streptomyces rapamycinicus]RLV71672.1 murein biosynthesis integral membrane protein MurJ [Streptomyces rapamycinicus NRRL 5491]UTP36929.1 murein biosynthesis integral membrane protein MurJ [Streptomyces rapamycinicus NRRL 5491]